MSTDLTPMREKQVAEFRDKVSTIQRVLKDLMKPNVHYGTVGTSKKKTLLKPGAEAILATFRLGAEPEKVEDLSKDDMIRYRIRVRIFHIPDNNTIGYGIGECSSAEEKYRWRASVCDQEYEAAGSNARRVKYKKWSGNVSEIKQVRVEAADVANTVLKMAKKRALVDGVLTATAASDCFEQDIEDLPEGMVDDTPPRTPPKAPGRKSEKAKA